MTTNISNISIITILGIFIVFMYGVTKLLDFYGIGINMYGSYLAFYCFIIISLFVLPQKYPTIKIK